jgi:ABC-2 type transport system ATP-binding protein
MLEISGVTKFYARAVGIENIDLRFERGEVVGLFGENGSGKTTLIKAIMGLTPLDAGWIGLDGCDISGPAYEKLAFVTEESTSFPALTVPEHGEFYRRMLPRFDGAKFDHLTETLGLPRDRKARGLSRGMRQRLEIAVGMSRGADFVLMDEPFLGEDVFARRALVQIIIESLTDDSCFVIATHQVQEVEPLLSRAVVLRAGRVAADEDVERLRERGDSVLSLIRSCYAPEGASLPKRGGSLARRRRTNRVTDPHLSPIRLTEDLGYISPVRCKQLRRLALRQSCS